jgi:hypothetical protein
MDWYCSLTEHILKPDNIMVGMDSFQSVQNLLENKVVALYEALLLYQIKSACSFYRNQGLVFLRGLANLDDWDVDLKSVTDAEAALQKDLDQFNNQHAKAFLGRLVEKAEEREALLGDIRQALRDSTALQKEIRRDEKDTKCLRDLRPTDPRHDKTRIENTKGGLLQGAYRWILDNPEFRQWRDGEGSLLWIKGDPGKGKTMLLCGIIDELSTGTRLRDEEGTTLLSYFFCEAADLRINNATAVLRGLIYMLLDQQPSLLPHARKAYDVVGKALFEDANSWFALSEILTSIQQDPMLTSAYLITDALDECVTDLPKLLDLIARMSSLYPRVKWIVSSRNWSNIEKALNKAKQRVRLSLELNEESVSAAVTTYIRYKVDQLAAPDPATGDTPYTREELDTIQHHLSSNAQGTFLWVALACQDLVGLSGWEAIQRVKVLPVGLDALYRRMLQHICKSLHATLCKSILAVILVVRRPITVDELPSLVAIPAGCTGNYNRLAEIIGFCGSFLTLRDRTVSVVHQSAKDFLLELASDKIFPHGKELVHHTIFSRSLQVLGETLRRNLYDLHFPGFPVDQVNPPQPDPLAPARYSCVYWIDHLLCAPSRNANDLQDGGSVDKFLRRSCLYWLEALSLLRSISEGILSIAKLDGLLQVRLRHSYVNIF